MSDDLQNQLTPPLSVSPAAPTGTDIFAGVDPVTTPPPAAPRPLEPLATLPELEVEASQKKMFVWLGIVVAVVVVGIGGWFAYSQWLAPTSPATPIVPAPAANQPVEPEAPISPTPTPVDNDYDRDGLTNAEEQQLGTDPYNADTDGDGLYDRDEAVVWHTDPLNADSDGDSYLDGAEVANGFNPRGAGKLLELPTSTAP
jgi:hypothetical protein